MRLRELLKRTPFYAPYRFIKNWLGRRREVKQFAIWTVEDEGRKQFYSNFVNKGETVFDVGANVGNRSKVFLELGCHVVAVEPQSRCVVFLEEVLGNRADFLLVRAAAGAVKSFAEIQIADAHTISSMSSQWISAVRGSGRHSQYNWEKTETVAVVTLDALIAEFGLPVFIKIDVEGYEDEVLAGLSAPVKAISFEFHGEFLEKTRHSVKRLSALATYEFNLSFGESLTFNFVTWVSGSKLLCFLRTVDTGSQGDIYARKTL